MKIPFPSHASPSGICSFHRCPLYYILRHLFSPGPSAPSAGRRLVLGKLIHEVFRTQDITSCLSCLDQVDLSSLDSLKIPLEEFLSSLLAEPTMSTHGFEELPDTFELNISLPRIRFNGAPIPHAVPLFSIVDGIVLEPAHKLWRILERKTTSLVKIDSLIAASYTSPQFLYYHLIGDHIPPPKGIPTSYTFGGILFHIISTAKTADVRSHYIPLPPSRSWDPTLISMWDDLVASIVHSIRTNTFSRTPSGCTAYPFFSLPQFDCPYIHLCRNYSIPGNVIQVAYKDGLITDRKEDPQ